MLNFNTEKRIRKIVWEALADHYVERQQVLAHQAAELGWGDGVDLDDGNSERSPDDIDPTEDCLDCDEPPAHANPAATLHEADGQWLRSGLADETTDNLAPVLSDEVKV